MSDDRIGVRLLAGAAAGLAAVAVLAWAQTRRDPNEIWAGLVAAVAAMLLLALPAFWWRRRGGRAWSTLLVAAAGPLLVFEGLLARSAWRYRNSGGDLQGIEQVLMVLVLVPILACTLLVGGLAIALVKPAEPSD